MSEPTELLPCPWCGNAAEIEEPVIVDGSDGWVVTCSVRECPDGVVNEDSQEEAIRAWNTRAPSPETEQLRARVAELEAALREASAAILSMHNLADRLMGDTDLDDDPDMENMRDAFELSRRITAALSGTTSTLDALIADAVRAEREACAEVCEARRRAHRRASNAAKLLVEEEEVNTRHDEAAACADAIRARGES